MASRIEIIIGAKDTTKKPFGTLKKRFLTANKVAIAWAAGVAAAALAVGRAILGAAKRAQEFNKQLGQIATLTAIPMKTLRKEVQLLAGDFGLAKDELTKGLYDALSAGIPEGNVFEFMRTASKAAIAGASDTASAVDILTTTMNAFKIPATEAEAVADTLFTTVRLGKTTLTELSQSLAQVAPLAAASGIRFEEISAAIATLTKQGTKTPQAITQIRQTIIALNENLGDGWSKTMSFQDALVRLRESAGGSDNALKQMVGRVEGVIGVLGLTGDNAAGAAKDLDEMTRSAGAMGDAFAEMEDLNPLDKLAQQADNVKTSFGAAALASAEFRTSIETLGGVLNFINRNMEKVSAGFRAFFKQMRVGFAVATGGLSEFNFGIVKLLAKLGNKDVEVKVKPVFDKAAAAKLASDRAAALKEFDAKKAAADKEKADKKAAKAKKQLDAAEAKAAAVIEAAKSKAESAERAAEAAREKAQRAEQRRIEKIADTRAGIAGLEENIAQDQAGAAREAVNVRNQRQLQEAKDDLFALTPEAKAQERADEARKERVRRLQDKVARGTGLSKRDADFLEMERAKERVQKEQARIAAEQEKQRQQDIKDAQTARDKMVKELGNLNRDLVPLLKAV